MAVLKARIKIYEKHPSSVQSEQRVMAYILCRPIRSVGKLIWVEGGWKAGFDVLPASHPPSTFHFQKKVRKVV